MAKSVASRGRKDLYRKYTIAIQRLTPKQRRFADLYLNGATAGNAAASAREAGYGGRYPDKDVHRLLPSPGFNPDVTRERGANHPLTLAIWFGLKIRTEETRRIEESRSDQRVKFGITPEWVLKNLKEMAVRTMGYEFDPETLDRMTGSIFVKSNFQPAAAQRTLEALGRAMGMFYDRGPGEKAKIFDEMDEAELDAEIARIDVRIAELQSLSKTRSDRPC